MIKNFLKNLIKIVLLMLDERILRGLVMLVQAARGFDNNQDMKVNGEYFLINKILKQSNIRTAIDIGGNVGDYSAELCKVVKETLHIFEPQEDLHDKIRCKTRAANCEVFIHAIAISETNTARQLHIDESKNFLASIEAEVAGIEYVNFTSVKNIKCITLDEFINKKALSTVDFIKIDTEGHEESVLRGAVDLIEFNPPKFVQIEFNIHQMYSRSNLLIFSGYLKNYRLYQILPKKVILRDPRDPVNNYFHYSNFLFVRSDIDLDW